MKIDLRAAKNDSGVSCLRILSENDVEKEQINNMFYSFGHLFQCEKKDESLNFILKPQRQMEIIYKK